MDSERAITCPNCGTTSYNRDDIAYEYCGNCHDFHDRLLALVLEGIDQLEDGEDE